ncbi:MAG: hypothetical protein M1828_002738 [Chrysothrix sp. TS-e1954]|nr:MAG: hypothetical protein M1828_002738 [Chrysothrix sp. TS-e1954]
MHESINDWTDVLNPGPSYGAATDRNEKHHKSHADAPIQTFYDHSSARRVNTDTVIATAIKDAHPQATLTIIPAYTVPLLTYAAAGYATAIPLEGEDPRDLDPFEWRTYLPAARRLDDEPGIVASNVIFAKYRYDWQGQRFMLYVVDGRDGGQAYPTVKNQYLVGPLNGSKHKNASLESFAADETGKDAKRIDVDALIRAAGQYHVSLHNEIWVFDSGYWQKDAALYQGVMKARWEDVILDENMKKALQDNVTRFFDSRDRYERLKVPWKRGVIYHGPPGNGKTVSLKAMMKTLYDRPDPIPTLYVRSLASFGGPERAIADIFSLARATAPCILVFEDLDSMITPGVRSYFLNQVDGLDVNDGIFMVGSTNHLDQLDPGIAKRPSRFDRKFYFPKPDQAERAKYAEYWRTKLRSGENGDGDAQLDFPKSMCDGIARLTDGFSFAYMQEAFVATLLAIAAENDKSGESDACTGKADVEAKTVKTEPESYGNVRPGCEERLESKSQATAKDYKGCAESLMYKTQELINEVLGPLAHDDDESHAAGYSKDASSSVSKAVKHEIDTAVFNALNAVSAASLKRAQTGPSEQYPPPQRATRNPPWPSDHLTPMYTYGDLDADFWRDDLSANHHAYPIRHRADAEDQTKRSADPNFDKVPSKLADPHYTADPRMLYSAAPFCNSSRFKDTPDRSATHKPTRTWQDRPHPSTWEFLKAESAQAALKSQLEKPLPKNRSLPPWADEYDPGALNQWQGCSEALDAARRFDADPYPQLEEAQRRRARLLAGHRVCHGSADQIRSGAVRGDEGDSEYKNLKLWKEMERQVKILRDEM